jgi:hypothetical protein
MWWQKMSLFTSPRLLPLKNMLLQTARWSVKSDSSGFSSFATCYVKKEMLHSTSPSFFMHIFSLGYVSWSIDWTLLLPWFPSYVAPTLQIMSAMCLFDITLTHVVIFNCLNFLKLLLVSTRQCWWPV